MIMIVVGSAGCGLAFIVAAAAIGAGRASEITFSKNEMINNIIFSFPA
jgi:hypothetical protein